MNNEINEKTDNKCSMFWMGLALFLLGIILGFVTAPIKKGITIGSHNSNCNAMNTVDSDDEDFEEIVYDDYD